MKHILFLFTAVFMLLSCKVGQVHKVPEIENIPDKFNTQDMATGTTSDIGWSSLYEDAVLQSLILRALSNNKDMLIAASRVKELMAAKRMKRADIFPNLYFQPGYEFESVKLDGVNTDNEPIWDVEAFISWELDVWGNLRWQNEASIAEYLQSVEAQNALQLTIVSEVAKKYFELKILDRELFIVKQTLEARREGAKVTTARYEGGLTSEIPFRQSLVELSRTETLIPILENEVKLKESELSILTGEFPHEVVRDNDISDFKIMTDLPVDIPSSLLQRRPDVRQAEQRLRQANAKVGVAHTDRFPHIKITGSAGLESHELENLLKSPVRTLIADLTLPLFNMGKKKAAHEAAKAAYEQEIHNYEKKILNVFREVHDALITFQKATDRQRSAETLYQSVMSYHELAKLQYVNGIIGYIDVLDAQRQLFDAEIMVNDAILNKLLATVTLYKVLGGGINR